MKDVTRADRLTDAGLAVLAAQGMRGLTHRAVDAEAQVPQGTCSNYFRTREELIAALGRRIFDRLTPDDDHLRDRAAAPPTRDHWVRLMVELFERAREDPELHLALLELRLEATRRPELVEPLTAVVRRAFEADLEFHESAGLPGGAQEIVLLHLAVGGLITELLTLPDALGIEDPAMILGLLVDRLVYPSSTSSGA
ncbi:MAG: TetR family transcriptional regulator [Actinomycetota bacterium]